MRRYESFHGSENIVSWQKKGNCKKDRKLQNETDTRTNREERQRKVGVRNEG